MAPRSQVIEDFEVVDEDEPIRDFEVVDDFELVEEPSIDKEVGPDPDSSLTSSWTLGNVLKDIAGIPGGLYRSLRGYAENLGDVAAEDYYGGQLGNIGSLASLPGRAFYRGETLESGIDKTVRTVAGLTGPAYPIINQGYEASKELLGLQEPRTPGKRGEDIRRDAALGSLFAAPGIAKEAIGGVLKKPISKLKADEFVLSKRAAGLSPAPSRLKGMKRNDYDFIDDGGVLRIRTNLDEAFEAAKGNKIISSSPERTLFNINREVAIADNKLLGTPREEFGLQKGPGIVDDVDKVIRAKGDTVDIAFSAAQDYVDNVSKFSPELKNALQEELNNIITIQSKNVNTLRGVIEEKRNLYKEIGGSSYERLPSLRENYSLELKKAVAHDLKVGSEEVFDKYAGDINADLVGQASKLNKIQSDLLTLKPDIIRAAGSEGTFLDVLNKSIPFHGAMGAVLGTGAGYALTGTPLGAVGGATLGSALGSIKGQQALTKGTRFGLQAPGAALSPAVALTQSPAIRALAAASQKEAPRPSAPSVPPGEAIRGLRDLKIIPSIQGEAPLPTQGLYPQENLFAEGLPRDTLRFNDQALASFALQTTMTPGASVAQGLITKFIETKRSGDSKKLERIVSDMARMFPQFFENGMGVNNKLFHKDQQDEYMLELKRAERSGIVDSIFLGKQENSFRDPNDSRILDLSEKAAQFVDRKAKGLNTEPTEVGDMPIERQYLY